MKIRCIIVEDEPLARKLMEEYVRTTPSLELLKSFGNPLQALEFLREEEVDLLFSDIQMKEITGLTLLKLLQKKPMVVLTTAYSEYAIEGFDLDVTDYLLKPITFERFLKAVEKVTQRFKDKQPVIKVVESKGAVPSANEFIFIKDGTKLLKIRLKDILYIQSLKDYVKVKTADKQIVSLQTMKSLEGSLPSNMFIRIHNSTIIAFDAIEEIERDKVKILDQYFPISDSYKKSFKEFIDSKKV
ncbi:LytR/AlgR family response regulator transcription factor [Arcticibacterium luteifluviistationis]|uniref:DNA-binding response regulator n=1 Tax=Arcticibacterium luteifluviistationis TaxID=1784714 RepID=A0A2Z4GA12_9BACT|nr:LytTR family DNA-binding domain-containing protein [Arcticibacterium luteifluviistationis]AWV98079.1 DNA-binding response regulator [Arcticibacterium luteifluviistationis]